MQTYQKRQSVSQAAPSAVPAVQPSGPSMDALRAGTAQPTSDMLGHKVDLPSAMQAKMESAFSADLSAVQLYESQAVADAGAEAVTQGSRIAFAPGKLDFTSMQGQALLGHELSHVVSQARGEVSGGGFLSDHALEARADREGFLAAQGQSVAEGGFAPLPSVSAASAEGPMQAKKHDDSLEISEPTLVESTDNRSGTPLPARHKIDARSMNFGKRAYQDDQSYQALQGLIANYNETNSADDEIALMDAAMAYINDNSTQKTARHKGRTANAEKILYTLGMKGDIRRQADANADSLRQAASESEQYSQESVAVIDALKDIYQEGSGYSSAMRMIAANIFANQNASGHAEAPEFQGNTTTSGASVKFESGAQGYQDKHHYNIQARTEGTQLNDSIGTTLHELTHVANGEIYQNTDNLISARSDSSPQEYSERRDKRLQALFDIQAAESSAKTQTIANQNNGTQSLKAYTKDRLEYAGGQKLGHYMSQKADKLNSDAIHAYQNKTGSTNDKIKFRTAPFAKMMAGSTDAQEIGDTTRPADLTPNLFDENTRNDLARQSKMLLQTQKIVNSLKGDLDAPSRQAAVQLNEKENQYGDVYGSNTLVENDSVLNQMLLQYEHAGKQSGKMDTDSLYYRRLKAAALQAHVDRQRAKLQQQH